jgi:hypothetical protein
MMDGAKLPLSYARSLFFYPQADQCASHRRNCGDKAPNMGTEGSSPAATWPAIPQAVLDRKIHDCRPCERLALTGHRMGYRGYGRCFSVLIRTGRGDAIGDHAMPFPSPDTRALARGVSDFVQARN